MNFSDEQIKIIEAPVDEKSIVIAAQAAGKTAVLTERVRYLLKHGIEPNKMVCLTFTNNAADEMRLRLADDFKDGLFIGTIHSYANYLLQTGGYETNECIANEEFDELFGMVMEHPEVIKPIDYLLCDESQDLNEHQYIFITTLIDPKACLFVGDCRQSIYGFNGADPKLLEKMMYDDDYVVYELTQNYRNGKVILEYSNRIANKMRSVKAEPMKCMRERDGSVRAIKNADIFTVLSMDPDWKKWAILCRSNKKVDSIMRALKARGIPCITFKQAANNLTDLKEKIDSNAIKVLTIHSAKGLQFDNVMVFGMRFATKDEEEMRVNYVAVTRARNELYLVTER